MARTYFGEDDLPTVFADFGVEVSIADQWYTQGIVDEVDREMLPAEAASLAGRLMTVLVKTDTLGPQLKEGVDITVDQVLMRVYSVMREADGALTRIIVTRKP